MCILSNFYIILFSLVSLSQLQPLSLLVPTHPLLYYTWLSIDKFSCSNSKIKNTTRASKSFSIKRSIPPLPSLLMLYYTWLSIDKFSCSNSKIENSARAS